MRPDSLVAVALALLVPSCTSPARSTASAGTGTTDGSGTDGVDTTLSGTDASTADEGGTDTPTESSATDTGDPAGSEPFASGERLTAIVERNSEGNAALSHWRDTELEIDCLMLPTGDGERHCLPRGFATRAFADPLCSEPAVLVGCDAPTMVSTVSPDCYDPYSPYTAWEVGPALDVAYRVDDKGTCIEISGPTAYEVTELDPSSFVRATAERVTFDALARLDVQGDDGSFQWIGPLNLQDEFCGIEGDVCVSYNRATVAPNVHQDSSCTSADVAFDVHPARCPTPVAVETTDGTFRGLGSMLNQADLFFGPGPADCTPGSKSSGGARFFAIRDDADFPAAHVRTDGSGRVHPRVLVDDTDAPIAIPFPPWFDETLGVPCRAHATVGGETVCTPYRYAGSEPFFADPSCDVPLIRSQRPLSGWYTRLDYSVCGGAVDWVGRIGGLHDGDVYDTRTGGCDLLGDPDAYGDFYDLAEIIAPSDLAPLTEGQ